MISLNLQGYYEYPYGKGSSFVNNIQQRKDDMTKEFDRIKDSIKSKIYQYGNKSIIYHIMIPSNSNPNLYYDVVIDIPYNTNIDLRHSNFKVYSNSPSFIFTYAHAFRVNGLLITYLSNKYDKRVKTSTSSTKNMYNVIGMERSLYLSTLYILKNNLTNISEMSSMIIKISNYRPIITTVKSQDDVKATPKLTNSKAIQNMDGVKSNTQKQPYSKNKNVTSKTKNITTIKQSKQLGSIKKPKKVKKI